MAEDNWPNSWFWSALEPKELQLGETPVGLSVVDCGKLKLPSGRLVACDPFAFLEPEGNAYVQVPPGEYRVKVTLADVSGLRDGSHVREAYASLLLSDAPEVTRKLLTPLAEGEKAPTDLKPGEYIGFPVDAGTACFVDDSVVASGMPDPGVWYDQVFDSGKADSWFSRMDDPGHIREGLANIVLPLAKNGENIVIIHSGWGDGVYPVIGGYDATGNLVRVHIDFMVIAPPLDRDE